MAIEFGLVIPAGPPREQIVTWLDAIDRACAALPASVKSLWVTDHFFWDDAPTYEAWTTLTYLAARYPAYTVGPIVLSQSYRNPALLAKMAATLQLLSGGRFVMAIGAGWKADEYAAYGYDFPSPKVRLEQLQESLEIMTQLWRTPGKVTFHGQHYHIEDAYCEPKPTPVPPILIGGGGNKTIALAVKYADMWNVPDCNPATYAEKVEVVKATCAAQGRDPNTLQLSWFGRLAVGETVLEAEALSNGQWTAANALVGTFDDVVAQIRELEAAGASFLMVDVLGLYDRPDIQARFRELVALFA
jgi:alkanesulfonate monooxygenase SsuD/methylene tetrahydromethanopterin reductase-like flavin-dependent oxidoreductase (luciferase family)